MLSRLRSSAVSVSLRAHAVCVAALLALPTMAWGQTAIAVTSPNGAERVYTAEPIHD